MKILYLSHCLPFPPDKGDRIRAYHQIRVLSRRHDVHLVALTRETDLPSSLPELERLCERLEILPIPPWAGLWRSLLAVPSSSSLTAAYYRSAYIRRRLQQIVQSEDLDCVLAYSSAVAPYCLAMQEIPVIVDMVDVDSLKWSAYASSSKPPKSWIYKLEAKRLRSLERQILETFDTTVVSTVREENVLRSEGVGASVATMRNGVCVQTFSPDRREPARHPTLVFTGQMDYLPNVEAAVFFVNEVMPQLRTEIRGLEFIIVGRSPTTRVRALSDHPGVVVTGEVADIRPFLDSAWVFVAPLRIARGIQNKVLEALAAGLPVVCSPEVMRGLVDGEFEVGRDLLVADSPDEWSRTLGGLLESPSLMAEMGVRGRGRLAKTYSWEANVGELEQMMIRVVNQKERAVMDTLENHRQVAEKVS